MTVKKETEEKYAEICYILLGKKKNTILGGKQRTFAISTENNHISHLRIFMATNQDCSNVTQQLSTQNFPYINETSVVATG